MRQWFAVQTHQKGEIQAEFNLRRQGFGVYLPQFLKLRRHARKQDWVKAPLFPRYLFVNFDIRTDSWHSIKSTIGVNQIICQGSNPVSLSDDIIAKIRGREDDSGNIRIGKICAFTPGQTVQVIEGALVNQFGIFDCDSSEEWFRVLFNLLGLPINIDLPIDSIKASF